MEQVKATTETAAEKREEAAKVREEAAKVREEAAKVREKAAKVREEAAERREEAQAKARAAEWKTLSTEERLEKLVKASFGKSLAECSDQEALEGLMQLVKTELEGSPLPGRRRCTIFRRSF